jgi:very-long-chain (3R)-3-hydroxyacyl-CoA dehydratase
VSSRLWLVWGINVLCPDSRYQLGFPLMVFSWGLVEVPRYSFYALNLYDAVPSALFFLRYHLFMVLYPSGVAGEVLCMVSALPFLRAGAYAIQMPNAHNVAVSLYTLVLVVLAVYVPGLPVMYSHMLTQRNRAYAKTKTA